MPFFVGIDVGTGSARAGVFAADGTMRASASRPIRMWKPEDGWAEQSSEDIWNAVAASVREAVERSGIAPAEIAGLGFDATCSLVLLDIEDRPVSVSRGREAVRNVIVWMDHRAVDQAGRINRMGHPQLRYVGKTISPEMQTPKLLWIKENLPGAWKRTARFFDLPDFLTYRATGDETRSLCSTVCKWTYSGHAGGWDPGYFRKIGLGDLVDEGFGRIGRRVRPMGEAVGRGLTERAAMELGLRPGTAVGVSIIDAHAGGIGLLGTPLGGKPARERDFATRLALIGGTSSCFMAVSPKPRFIPGIWGPYYSAMIPGLWLTEGGQSASGALIDHVITGHPAYTALHEEAAARGQTVYQALNERLDQLAEKEGSSPPGALTRDLHILPDFHGNRSPRADPTLKGAVVGLTLCRDLDDLARLYLAAIQSVAYGARHILEEMGRKGFAVRTLLACGGGTKNPVFLREHADITGCRVVLAKEPEAVLLGSAMLGAVAAGEHGTVPEAMAAMSALGSVVLPAKGAAARYHERKYRVFQRMHGDFCRYRKLMGDV